MNGEMHGEDPRVQTAEDQGIYNGFMADAAQTGVWPQQAPAAPLTRPFRQDGRGYPLDYRQPEQYKPLAVEEIAAREAALNGDGHRRAQDIARRAANSALTKTVHTAEDSSEAVWLAARQRARQEHRERPPAYR